jgi:hypothetical protein
MAYRVESAIFCDIFDDHVGSPAPVWLEQGGNDLLSFIFRPNGDDDLEAAISLAICVISS